jgi:PadR family transcriptional regulator PadR
VNESDDPVLRKFQRELNSGSLSLAMLALLEQAGEPLYGYDFAKRLQSSSPDGLPVKKGTLYPLLRSMERSGLLVSSVEPSVSGPPRKYYSVTDYGREALDSWRQIWARTRNFVDATLKEKN